MITRRRFLKLLGLAPAAPVLAKLPVPEYPAYAKPGLTLAKMMEARNLLDQERSATAVYHWPSKPCPTDVWNRWSESFQIAQAEMIDRRLKS